MEPQDLDSNACVAIGMVVGALLSLLGTPILIVLLLAGLAAAHAFGWRLSITRKTSD